MQSYAKKYYYVFSKSPNILFLNVQYPFHESFLFIDIIIGKDTTTIPNSNDKVIER
jgi:hypothetical protein